MHMLTMFCLATLAACACAIPVTKDDHHLHIQAGNKKFNEGHSFLQATEDEHQSDASATDDPIQLTNADSGTPALGLLDMSDDAGVGFACKIQCSIKGRVETATNGKVNCDVCTACAKGRTDAATCIPPGCAAHCGRCTCNGVKWSRT